MLRNCKMTDSQRNHFVKTGGSSEKCKENDVQSSFDIIPATKVVTHLMIISAISPDSVRLLFAFKFNCGVNFLSTVSYSLFEKTMRL